MRSEVMCTANTFLSLCLGYRSPSPSAHVAYLSSSKLQWTLFQALRKQARLLGGACLIFTSTPHGCGILFLSSLFLSP